ncbi:hypothetical protein NQ317_000362 [Molorchus minor]|uniref:Uncharacterized protein n=1 Tax=Molorchus minor TaxID=1323400 RepID=A0ABQ9JMN9_9CUCU|nr:hypothetical protein NQ317_000362 [Molorchus minor]
MVRRKITENPILKKKSEHNKVSTLWANYSMLKSTLSLKENIDISKYLLSSSIFLKKKNIAYKPKKSLVFSK